MATFLPQSIQATNTTAIDETFLERLKSINVEQLLIDLENERDILKLSLYLQQFGIPVELLPKDLGDLQFRSLLQNVLHIYRLSGTATSIKMLAKVLGATDTTVETNAFALDHNRQSRHVRRFKYNQGAEFKKFAVSVCCSGIPASLQPAFKTQFAQLFATFQPINVYLNRITFN